MPSKQKGTIYLLKDRFQIYVPGMTSIVECRFPLEVIRDMDLVNQEKFANVIRLFITSSKIPPSSIIVVISDSTLFIKDFIQPAETPPQPGQAPKPLSTLIPLEELEKKAKEFLNLVPFEEILGKIIPLKNGYRVYAANKEILDALQRALEANNFDIAAILPAMVFGQEVNTKPIMDTNVAGTILRKSDSLIRDYNLLNPTTFELELEKEPEIELSEETALSGKPKNKLPLLLGVFGFLILILIIVAWTQLRPQPKPNPTQDSNPASQIQITPTATITLSPTAAPIVNAETITIQIINTSNTAEKATELKEYLEKAGLKNIILTSQQNISAPNTTITFSKNVGTELRTLVINEVQKRALSTNILEKSDTNTDITILFVN